MDVQGTTVIVVAASIILQLSLPTFGSSQSCTKIVSKGQIRELGNDTKVAQHRSRFSAQNSFCINEVER